ncbi:mycothiol conjugate amidase Mca [Corynebacterium sp. ES2794-CONJ1]|uniref:mycothiol conjugate amidase Mca n=1 Tax=unclassified Corynebacterium TaxID=2624378 RepID=UPI00216AC385|nr:MULTISPECIES: mycothiol conjugate amidase Mca [unclassified Corynebacterium]MCS4531802.1 mycothiol conjugate amidase Mca [Corynebacterium sp. ES2730-CONJ]MCU9519198.1 mycothiol conjugate amidase Mca [Corynebacterium sp. ES2794-CONJ1]
MTHCLPKILAIHAHPDDESSKGAATMARYISEGHEVLVVSCTGGERGDILNPAMDRPGIKENIREVRKDEMAKAAAVLGVEHRWLGYEDSGLPQGDPLPPLPEGCFALVDSDEITQKLVKIIREFKPEVILTYDENGGYPHPDHLKVHEVSLMAWEYAGNPQYHPELGAPFTPLKLYYTHGFVVQRLQLFHELASRDGAQSPYGDILEHFKENGADLMKRVTTRVECSDFFDARDAALRAHATQIDPDGLFFFTPVDVQREYWPTEEFELAFSRVPSSLPETDLFAGLDSQN